MTDHRYQKKNAHVQDVFARYSRTVHAFLRRLVDGQDAKDLMQEVFGRYLQVDEETLVEDPGKYLFGIAIRVAAEYRNKRYRGPLSFESGVLERLSDGQIAATDNPVEQEALQHERQEDLKRKIAALPWTYRQILNLYMTDGYKHEDIAKKLGLSIHTVRCYLRDAKLRLRMSWYG